MKTPAAERQKAYRDRLKVQERAALVGSGSASDYRTPFSNWVQSQGGPSDFELPLDIAGIEAPTFDDERGPEDFVKNNAMHNVENPFDFAGEGAIGRAEVVIDSLLDAAAELARLVNHYKRTEIEARLKELEKSKKLDGASVIKEGVRLNKILDLLDKQVRRNFHEWK